MKENQKSSNDRLNQESRSKRNEITGFSGMKEGKAKGSPSNVKNENEENLRRNTENRSDESRLQGNERSGRINSDLNRSRDNDGGSRRN